MINLTLRQLRALRAIKAEGKVVAAARALGLTAPAVTLQLKQLEEEVGFALFDRTPHGMRPTAVGDAFIEAAEDVLARLAVLDEEVAAITGMRKGDLTIGVVSTAEYFAPQLTAAFRAAHPALDVRLVPGKRAETVARLKHYEVDVMLTPRLPRDITVRAKAFAEYRMVAVSAPQNPLARRKGLTREDLAAEHLIVREEGSGPRISVERFLGEKPGRPRRTVTVMESNRAVNQAVMADLGIALVATHTVSAELEAGSLVVLDVVGLPIRQQWFAITRTDHAITPVMASFEDFLVRYGAGFLQPHAPVHE